MNDAEAAWLAGLFEGEGSVNHHVIKGGPNVGRSVRQLVIKMTDLDVLERVHALVGGSLIGPSLREGCKPCWTWYVSNWRSVVKVGEAIRPWLCSRRGVALDALLADPPARIGGGRAWQQKCKRGHWLEGPEADVYLTKAGGRACRRCVRERKGPSTRRSSVRADPIEQARRAKTIEDRKAEAANLFPRSTTAGR